MVFLANSFSSFSQDQNHKIKLYDTWVFLLQESKPEIKGYTHSFNDSTISILQKYDYRRGTMPLPDKLRLIRVNDIDQIMFRKKGSKAAGMLIFGFFGGLIGAYIGYSNGDDPPSPYEVKLRATAEAKAFAGALIGGGTGMGIGILIGSSKKKIIIHGNIGNYIMVRPDLEKYSIKYYSGK